MPPDLPFLVVAGARGFLCSCRAQLQASSTQASPNTSCAGGGPARPSGWTCRQKEALEGSHTPPSPGVAGPDPESAVGPGEDREAREALVLPLADPSSAHPRRSHLSARVSLHSSLQKKPSLHRFTMAGGGSGVVGQTGSLGRPVTRRRELCSAVVVGERVALLGLRGRADSRVAPSGFRPTAVGQEGRPVRGRASPRTVWADRVANAQGTAGHGPLRPRGHVVVSVKRDLGRRAKRLWAWRVPPDLSCEVTHESANPGSPRTPVTCLGGGCAVLERVGYRAVGKPQHQRS